MAFNLYPLKRMKTFILVIFLFVSSAYCDPESNPWKISGRFYALANLEIHLLNNQLEDVWKGSKLWWYYKGKLEVYKAVIDDIECTSDFPYFDPFNIIIEP